MKKRLENIYKELTSVETDLLDRWREEKNAAEASKLIADVNRVKRAYNQIEQIILRERRQEEKEEKKKE